MKQADVEYQRLVKQADVEYQRGLRDGEAKAAQLVKRWSRSQKEAFEAGKHAAVPQPRGRPVVPEDQRLHIYNIRLTRSQIEKLGKLGGAAWVRDRIDHARVKEKAPD